ncbi:STAS domain-containing protein [Phytohabitans sp. LJ34]|uniref:STAS domain-containing protein n=1 Tax=Phytohabitans sp. LJ34 TaxID=3452217 RepID=UPI003F8B3B59
MLTITETARNGTVALTLAGDLDMSTCTDLLAAVEKVRDATAVTLDCTDLRFCDATGVSALLEARAKARSAGIDLTLANVHGVVRRVLTICDVLRILTRI